MPAAAEEELRIIAWRRERLLELGYSDEEAGLISLYDVDWHRLAKLIAAGCSRWDAWKILQPEVGWEAA